jgi:hypothetical protein
MSHSNFTFQLTDLPLRYHNPGGQQRLWLANRHISEGYADEKTKLLRGKSLLLGLNMAH